MRANILTILTLLLVSLGVAYFIGCSEETSAEKDLKDEDFYALAQAKAQSTSGPGEPALWKLSDEDSDVYLLGTVHLLRPETQWQTDKIKRAFDESRYFYMEADIMSPETQQFMMKFKRDHGLLPPGKSLYDHMDVGDAYNFKRALEGIGFKPKALDNLQPWLASMEVAQYQILTGGYNPLSGVEIVLIGKAKEQGKPMRYLETIEHQMEVLSGGKFDEQLDTLVAMTDLLDKGTASLDLLVDEWADGDVAGLGALVANSKVMGSEDFYDRLLTQRNRNWIPQIIDILDEPGSSFVAVGAAHLAGDDSVILLLEDAGYKAERIQ